MIETPKPKSIVFFLLRAVALYVTLVIVAAVAYHLAQPALTPFQLGVAVRASHLRERLLVPAFFLAFILRFPKS